MTNRGFGVLVGRTVIYIDSSSINVVHLHLDDGSVLSVDSEDSYYGIPVIRAVDGTEEYEVTSCMY